MGMAAQSSTCSDPARQPPFRSTSIRWAVRVSKWDPTVAAYKDALAMLNEDEAKRVAKFRFFDDAKRSLMGRLLIRKLLVDIMQMPAIDLKRTTKGKPYIANPQECPIEELKHMQFNVSHHGDWVVLAAESCFSIGLDVMGIERPGRGSLGSFFKNMRSNFSEGEWSHVMVDEGGDKGKLTRFMRLWTLKESYVKARGEGLSISPNRVCFEVKRKQRGSRPTSTSVMQQKPPTGDEGDTKDSSSANADESSSSSGSSDSSIFRDRKCWEQQRQTSAPTSNLQPATRRRQDHFLQGKYERDADGEKETEEEKGRNGGRSGSGGGSKAVLAPKLLDPYTDMSHLLDGMPELLGATVQSLSSSTPAFRFSSGAFDTEYIWSISLAVLPACIPPRTSTNEFNQAIEAALVCPFYEIDPNALVATLKKNT